MAGVIQMAIAPLNSDLVSKQGGFMPEPSPSELDSIARTILQSKKYRGMNICPDTVYDLLAHELPRHKKKSDAIQAVREKLHHVVAPYLGEPDYEEAARALKVAFVTNNQGAIKQACISIMATHASTKERLGIIADFYEAVFKITGKPRVLSDVACALNPLSFPWMGLPNSTEYYAYDLNGKRVDFLNLFFSLQGLAPLAKYQDVFVSVPQEEADVALIMKEIHRFEQRRRGCTLPLLDALRARYIVITLPAISLSGRHDLSEHHRSLFYSVIEGRQWEITETQVENEMVFIIKK